MYTLFKLNLFLVLFMSSALDMEKQAAYINVRYLDHVDVFLKEHCEHIHLLQYQYMVK